MSCFRSALIVAICAAVACEAVPPAPQPEAPVRIVGWKQLAAWSGRGSMQTETFMSDTGTFRIHWETKNESPAGKGGLKVAFRSGDSGRIIIDAIDQRGVGRDSAEVGDMVRWYYLSIDSANVDWSVTVEEPIMGRTIVRTDP